VVECGCGLGGGATRGEGEVLPSHPGSGSGGLFLLGGECLGRPGRWPGSSPRTARRPPKAPTAATPHPGFFLRPGAGARPGLTQGRGYPRMGMGQKNRRTSKGAWPHRRRGGCCRQATDHPRTHSQKKGGLQRGPFYVPMLTINIRRKCLSPLSGFPATEEFLYGVEKNVRMSAKCKVNKNMN